jgi:putative hemolysin
MRHQPQILPVPGRVIVAVGFLALAACDPPARPPVPGPEARKRVDTATLAYADCVTKGAETAPLGRSPGVVVGELVRDCGPQREALATAIEDFHQIGHPRFSAQQLSNVAEASIQQLEPQIRSDAIAIYVGRTLPASKAE